MLTALSPASQSGVHTRPSRSAAAGETLNTTAATNTYCNTVIAKRPPDAGRGPASTLSSRTHERGGGGGSQRSQEQLRYLHRVERRPLFDLVPAHKEVQPLGVATADVPPHPAGRRDGGD